MLLTSVGCSKHGAFIIWVLIYLHSANPKQVNPLDVEQVKKIVPTHSSCWYDIISLKLF